MTAMLEGLYSLLTRTVIIFFSWVKKGDNIHFYDPQNPKLDTDKLFQLYKHPTGQRAVYPTTILRLDDLDINTDGIKRAIKNVSDKTSIKKDDFDTFMSKGKDFVMREIT